jgi:hypothetical protein
MALIERPGQHLLSFLRRHVAPAARTRPPAPRTVPEVLAAAEAELGLAGGDELCTLDRAKRLVDACDGRLWPPILYESLAERPQADQQQVGAGNPRCESQIPPSVAAEVRGLVREAQRDRAEKSKVAEVGVEEQAGGPLAPSEYAILFGERIATHV